MHLATMKKCALLLLAIFGFTALSLAQTVTGTVTDKKGEPLPGVTVSVKGTQKTPHQPTTGCVHFKQCWLLMQCWFLRVLVFAAGNCCGWKSIC